MAKKLAGRGRRKKKKAKRKALKAERLRLRALAKAEAAKRKSADAIKTSKAEAEAGAKRKAEEEAENKRKAEVEEARKAEEEAAAKRKAEEEAENKRKAEEEIAALLNSHRQITLAPPAGVVVKPPPPPPKRESDVGSWVGALLAVGGLALLILAAVLTSNERVPTRHDITIAYLLRDNARLRDIVPTYLKVYFQGNAIPLARDTASLRAQVEQALGKDITDYLAVHVFPGLL